jgi:transposase
MRDKQRQQRRGKIDVAIRSAVAQRPVEIRPLLPKRLKRPKGGRPPKDDRNVLEGILWSLRSGARWCDLPEEFPSPATCWRRLRDWEEQEVW